MYAMINVFVQSLPMNILEGIASEVDAKLIVEWRSDVWSFNVMKVMHSIFL